MQDRVEMRANALVRTWGKSNALEVANRHLSEARRSGRPEAISLNTAIVDEVARLLSAKRSA
jgi:hypothetical protein